jgi:hypothetical protein
VIGKSILIGLTLFASITSARKSERVTLGKLHTGAAFTFVKSTAGEWGIEITGGASPKAVQWKPARIEVYVSEENIPALSAGYKTINKTDSEILGCAEIAYGKDVKFNLCDEWKLKGNVVSVKRKVEVIGNAPGGFNSAVTFAIDPSFQWKDVNCFIPGALYGDPTYNGDRSIGGTMNYEAKRFLIREDILPAPMIALSFSNQSSVAILNPSPRGESTVEETRLVKNLMTDDRFQFGSFGVSQIEKNPIEFGFSFPGKMCFYPFSPNASAPRWIRRFHPISEGVAHSYNIDFRFGEKEAFRDLIRNSWRWAWNSLKPSVNPINVELVRRVLTDHLASQAVTIDGRTGIPFAVATFDTNKIQWNSTMTAMGFVSKNIECADQLLRESDRDKTERGQKMRQLGLGIISSMVNALNTVPLQAIGYDLATGKLWTGEHQEWLQPYLRNATEDMRVLMRAYRREQSQGYNHPEWFNWVKTYLDWLIIQQREDGSFPRRWKSGSSEVAEPTGTTSYCAVPLLVIFYEETKDAKYKQAAIRAAEYVWENFGTRGLYVGGASDIPNITDKEAGMLSMEAFLSLYELTKESKWLNRAKSAADYTESWMWIWNLPMPIDANDNQLHWKKGISTVGLQGITARGPGGVDEYLDWSASSYARLFKYTNDKHYLDVARILLHNTKAMLALPGRQYDMKGIGWQQEHWGMGPSGRGRGMGGHRFWLPWISANHLYSITGLEEVDPLLFKKLSNGN